MAKNELARAVSPYLLQHAENPVHWREWGPEALAEAQATDKPILLSIGYAACHWCHVMAHESFEHAPTAALMNELFVNIKVDREERPDIDHLYMSALHALGEQGGWPLTMFLTPSAEPFWGGTYFPRESRYGRPSFRDVLSTVAKAYQTQGAAVAQNARAIRAHLGQTANSPASELTLSHADRIGALLADAMDPINGGLKGAPKFPNPSILENVWRAADRAGSESMRGQVCFALEQMCRGGIFDHLGGGFARYSVDARWLVPHFEKMLYDNAQLLELLTLAWSSTRKPIFAGAAAQTADWLLRDMRNEDGGFCASLDADSEGVEGKFYVWTYEEIIAALGLDEGRAFAVAYDVQPGGNWRDEHSGQNVSVLNRLTSGDDDDNIWADARARLRAIRDTRIRPQRDDKILADWNGLAIVALARAAKTFDRSDLLDAARTAYHFVRDSILSPDRHERWHAFRNGVRSATALALDYAAMAMAALALAETGHTSQPYLRDAEDWLDLLWAGHQEPNGLLAMSAHDAADILLRLTPTHDDAIPNVHGLAVKAAVLLHGWTGEVKWLERADALLAATTPYVEANPAGHTGVLNALDLRHNLLHVVIIAPQDHELRRGAGDIPDLNRTIQIYASGDELPPAHGLAPLATDARPVAYVCSMDRCSAPAHSHAELLDRISAFSRHRT